MRAQVDIRVAQERQNRVIKRRRRELDLTAARRVAIFGHHCAQDLELDATQKGLVLLGVAAVLRNERTDSLVALEIQRVDPHQLVPDLQVADVFRRELRRKCARTESLTVAATSSEQLRVPREGLDHPRLVRVEKVLDAKG